MILLENLTEYASLMDEEIESLFYRKLNLSIKKLRFDSSTLTTLMKFDEVETKEKNDFLDLALIQEDIIAAKTITIAYNC